jgi:Domain of unknown function (DUF4381)
MNPASAINITGNLSELQDIIVTDSIGFYPPAPAWGPIAFLLAWFLIRRGYRSFRSYQANRYRREAEHQLSLLEKIILTAGDPGQCRRAAMALPGLLKQTAISAYKRETVASLNLDKWLAFLDETSGMTDFSGKTGRLLLLCAYGTPDQITGIAQEEVVQLIAVARKWIRKHETGQE